MADSLSWLRSYGKQEGLPDELLRGWPGQSQGGVKWQDKGFLMG